MQPTNIELIYVDLFCGAGGTSTGVLKAQVNGEQCAVVAACINHDNNAIRSHKSNHKQTLHFTEDITMLYKGGRFKHLVNHLEYVKALYPLAKVVLWASLECTNFSKAKGGQPRDADSRTLADHLFPYIDALNPDYIQIENVEEFMSWGELDANGKPISKLAGSDYLRWTNSVKKHGYGFEHRILNAANYGARTSRKRFFGQFYKKDLPIVWPEATHEEKPDKGLFGSGLKPWKPVKEVLDFSDEGESIFGRKKPLVNATLERIYAGLIKFVAGGKDKFLSSYYGNGDNVSSVEKPSPTVTTKDRIAIVRTKFIDQQFGQSKPSSIDKPLGAITTNPKYNVVVIKQNLTEASTEANNLPSFINVKDGAPVYEVYDTDFYIMVKIKEFMAMYGLVDIKMRMLRIKELKLIMGFPEDYVLIGTQADQKKFIGNAVEVTMARVMCESLAAKLIEMRCKRLEAA